MTADMYRIWLPEREFKGMLNFVGERIYLSILSIHTQLYISFKDCDVDVSRLRVEICLSDICHWMDVNELKLNHDKTEIMLIYWNYHTRPLLLQYG